MLTWRLSMNNLLTMAQTLIRICIVLDVLNILSTINTSGWKPVLRVWLTLAQPLALAQLLTLVR